MIDDDGEKQSAVFIAVRLISVERESVLSAKERFGSSLYFRAIGQKSDESHYIFSLSFRSFSREKKSAQNALKRERTSELIYKSRTFLSSSVVAFYYHPWCPRRRSSEREKGARWIR